jgi:predicted SAM-dependent methyltransferase
MTLRQRLKRSDSLVRAVRTLRAARASAVRSFEDIARLGRHERIAAYLQQHPVPKLHLGGGEHVQPGWLNTDLHDFRRKDAVVYLDARRPFPLPEASFDFVFSEHMLEHLTYAEGRRCLRECFRVLRPGGRIRVATPSLEQLAHLYDADTGDVQRRYVRWALDSFVPEADAELPGFVLNNFMHAWGHRFVYDRQTLRHALEAEGFVDVEEQRVGESGEPALAGLERHLSAEPEFNEYETLVLEARRP